MLLAGFALDAGSRTRQILQIAAASVAIGFAAIALKSAFVAQPVLGKVWIGEFYGRIEKVEILSARDVVRLQLATDGHQRLPPSVKFNL